MFVYSTVILYYYIESKKVVRRRKRDDDYYSSDEDTFLDRTGEAERKRKARMSEKNCVETYESLVRKLSLRNHIYIFKNQRIKIIIFFFSSH